jgi:hypothetical protein
MMVSRRFLILMVLSSLAVPGCSREWYYEQADENVTELIEEKTYNRWESPWTGIDMDPRSRFYDPYDPVRPPMPPDDPDSHQYMHNVSEYEGWAHWHDSGNLDQLENPGWYEQLVSDVPSKEDGTLFLTLEDAIRLARVNAPSYQQQLETLYLSALDVSTERFRLDTQFIGGAGGGGGRTFFNDTGVGITGAGTSSGSTFNADTTTDIQLRRNLASAGQFVVSFANQFMWQLSGADAGSVSSGIGFVFLQPLLRAGGRQIALEVLTVAERTLLANIRAFEHYRQGFFTNLAVGINDTTGPSRRGGFQGGSGFSGFSGQGSGGFGGVGDATGFGRTGGGGGGDGGAVVTGSGFAGGGAGQVGGFIGILQQTEQLRNTETSLNAQLQTLNLLEAHLEGGLIDLAQVDQFRQSIETERANLLQSQNGLANTVESFKTFSLGLPPDVPIELDDSTIRQFRFVSDSLKRQQEQLQAIVTGFGQIAADATDEQLQEVLGKLNDLNKAVALELASAASDVQRVADKRPKRTDGMSDFEKQTFDKELAVLKENLSALQKSFDEASQKVVSLLGNLGDDRAAAVAEIVSVNVVLSNLIGELALIETRARLDVITLDPVRLDPKVALEIARANRLDWMNNRASLVDNWRLIEFNANRLESNVDIFLSGDIGTKGDNPLNFSGENTSTQAGIRFDAPFNRLVERNDFRQQLILYQQSRRQLIQYEDGVYRGLRSLLRNLDQLERNLEIQRRAVAISIRRVDQTRENLNRPTPPALPGQPQAQFGPTAALNLLTALSDLRNSQNNFMSVWLNYYAARMRLFQNLGIMRIDTNGLWIEESLEEAVRATSEDNPLPPSVPHDWLDATGAEPVPAVEGDEEAAKLPPPVPAALPIHTASLSGSRRPLTAPAGSSGVRAEVSATRHAIAPPSSGSAPRILPVGFDSPQRPSRATTIEQPTTQKPDRPAQRGWRRTSD